jgi:hypothetical protein
MLPPGILSWTDTNNNEAFLAGQIALTQNAGTVYAKAVFDNVPFHEQIASRNPEAVADVARHFLSQPVQERVWSISTGYALPAYTNRWDSPIITENPISMAGKDIAMNVTDFTGLQWPGPLNEAIGSIGEGANYHDQFVQIFQDFGLDGE